MSDDETCAVVVRCSSECEDAVHPDVQSRGFKRLRRIECEGGPVQYPRIEEGDFSVSKS